MKVAVAAQGRDKTSLVDSRFGRCPYFQIINLDQPEEWQVLENPGNSARRGAGVTAGQFVADQGVDQAVAGNFGPNAVQVLESAGLKIVKKGSALSVEEIIEELLNAEK